MAKDGPKKLGERHIAALLELAEGLADVTRVAPRHGLSREWLSKTVHSAEGQRFLAEETRRRDARLLESMTALRPPIRPKRPKYTSILTSL